jgi:dienelactone hydrolase
MLQGFFHAWERRLASVTKDRVVRPFEWGLDWIPDNGHHVDGPPADVIDRYVSQVMADTDAFFTPPPTNEYTLTPAADGDLLTFPSALTTPHESNNTVRCRYFPARGRDGLKAVPYESDAGRHEDRSDAGRREDRSDAGRREDRSDAGRHEDRSDAGRGGSNVGHGLQAVPPSRAAVLVMPQWNSDAGGHVGLSKLLAWNGMSALRLSLPYHDQRMPAELHRADYIVSANVMRTLQVCRQAVLDARRAIAWLKLQGYERIGILGTSLGSCLALLTTAHEPLIDAEALNHISPYFADVVWRGLSTAHVREGLNGHVELDLLRSIWQPISPRGYLERLRNRKTLLVYARYDLTFPVDLSEDLVRAFRDLGIPHEVAVLRCGHYSSGKAPFKFVDGYILTRFLKRALLTPGVRVIRG